METFYKISLNIKTPSGFESCVNFDLGCNREKAIAIVEQLKGTENITENTVIYMDFTEVEDGIPLPVKMLHCTLDDVAYNVRIITRDIFKNLNL